MATEESFRYRHAAPPTHGGHDDDEQEEDGDDIYIMIRVCVFVTKNHHFLSAWDERLEAQSKMPAWPYRL